MQFSHSNYVQLSRKKIANTFGLKAMHYDQHAFFQSEVLEYLIAQFNMNLKPGQVWVDLGCGTGMFSSKLVSHKNYTPIIGIDISGESLKISAKTNYQSIQADVNSIPLKRETVDGFIMASMAQWLSDIESCILKLNSCLKNKGVLLFSVFTNDSFYEINNVKLMSGLSISIVLPSITEFLKILDNCGFSLHKSDILEKTYYFSSAKEALKSISKYGASATEKPLTRNILADLCLTYEKQFRCEKGVPVTYKAVVGIAAKDRRK